MDREEGPLGPDEASLYKNAIIMWLEKSITSLRFGTTGIFHISNQGIFMENFSDPSYILQIEGMGQWRKLTNPASNEKRVG